MRGLLGRTEALRSTQSPQPLTVHAHLPYGVCERVAEQGRALPNVPSTDSPRRARARARPQRLQSCRAPVDGCTHVGESAPDDARNHGGGARGESPAHQRAAAPPSKAHRQRPTSKGPPPKPTLRRILQKQFLCFSFGSPQIPLNSLDFLRFHLFS